MDTFKTKNGKTLKVTPIKHASMEIDFDGRIIQVDPVIDGTPPVTDYTQMAKADLIIITHDHYDHLDVQAVNDLKGDVEKHNNLVERMCKVEQQIPTMWKRQDELRDAMHDIKIGGTN